MEDIEKINEELDLASEEKPELEDDKDNIIDGDEADEEDLELEDDDFEEESEEDV